MRLHIILSVMLLALPALAIPYAARAQNDQPPFNEWLADFRQEAHEAGIQNSVLDRALSNVEPLPRVIELDHAQPENVLTLDEYLARVVTKAKIAKGRSRYAENKQLLTEIGKKYNVQPRYIVALWGIETNYGSNTGGFEIIPALVTLAYDGRRSDFFRGELINALRVMQEEHLDTEEMKGSWAGALGQCQFMPSSFLKYAVDYDGDGKRDIWNTPADVFASIANYLHREGWDGSHGLGSAKNPKSNFNVLLKWNRSSYFATAVGRLAKRVKEDE